MDLSRILGNWMTELENTPQCPLWHAEGNVLRHTQLVCQALESLDAYRNADETTQTILYLAAAFHDIGKISTTYQEPEYGQWSSPNHSMVGAGMTRRILWQDFGLCGTTEKQRIREAVCNLVRFHMNPPHAIMHPNAHWLLRLIASNGELIPGFCLDWLCTLAEADVLGRISTDQQKSLERIVRCRELAQEAGCLSGPYPFPSGYTAYAYLSGRKIPPEYPLYDAAWGEVIFLSGLPGTGKDTWIQANCSELPVISLDEIREELGISHRDDQSPVVNAAREQAKVLLRRKQRFVWNATNTTITSRKKLVSLFRDYGASTRMVYLETIWEEQLRRNASREKAVPKAVICRMWEKTSPPFRMEADHVIWQCV